MKLKFEKEESGNWYVVLPDWQGEKEELQMVLGADTMLDIIAKGSDSVNIKFETEDFEASSCLKLVKEYENELSGADYFLNGWDDKELNLEIWLCDVTKIVFGNFPSNIYFKKI